MRTIVEIAYYPALAQMRNLLAGYVGLVSIGSTCSWGPIARRYDLQLLPVQRWVRLPGGGK